MLDRYDMYKSELLNSIINNLRKKSIVLVDVKDAISGTSLFDDFCCIEMSINSIIVSLWGGY